MDIHQIIAIHTARFGEMDVVIRAPGRINLIGEHTDYNEGFVLPAAIDKSIFLTFSPRTDDIVHAIAADLDQSISWNIHSFPPQEAKWAHYIQGMVAICRTAGHEISGFNCVFGGDIPIGAGLSSSAALECGTGRGLIEMGGWNMESWELIKLAQQAEHQYVGVKCGIMDQFASVMGKSKHVMRLDCRNFTYEYIPLEMEECTLVLCDTQVSHSLASTAYNTRRAQCEAGVEFLQNQGEAVASLRDITREQLARYKGQLDPVIFRRCQFIVDENSRVWQACQALEQKDWNLLGELMYASHNGLQHAYEVSCDELDFLVEMTYDDDQVLGARMVGGGFGGCTLNLVQKAHVRKFSEQMQAAYEKQWNKSLPIYLIQSADGVSLEHVYPTA